MQIFLPSLPLIQSDLGVSAATAQLVLSLSMVAISFSMLVYGPLSDRFGRRPLLILGLVLFLVGSFVGAIAPNIATLRWPDHTGRGRRRAERTLFHVHDVG